MKIHPDSVYMCTSTCNQS